MYIYFCISKFVFFPLQLFALLGFVVSAVLISAVASEVVSVLHMLGVVLHLSNTVLGLTLLAWGNSIGGDISKVKYFYIHIKSFKSVTHDLSFRLFF